MPTRLTAAMCLSLAAALFLAGCGAKKQPAGVTPTTGPMTSVVQPEAEALKRGEMLYQANCLTCHGDRQGKGGSGGVPPHNEQGHTWHHPDAQLKEWVLNGRLFGGMPAFKEKVNEQDVGAILAFIKTWWTTEQRQSQADVSSRYQEALDKQKKGR